MFDFPAYLFDIFYISYIFQSTWIGDTASTGFFFLTPIKENMNIITTYDISTHVRRESKKASNNQIMLSFWIF